MIRKKVEVSNKCDEIGQKRKIWGKNKKYKRKESWKSVRKYQD